MGFSEWKKRLITHEDPFYLHKTLGLLALISYGTRIGFCDRDMDMGFRSHPSLTLPTVLLHMTLSTSSLIFSIPRKRIKSGWRIWPEYRAHSILFAGRHFLFILLAYLRETYHVDMGQHHTFVNWLIVMGTMAAADTVSRMYGKSPTIRGSTSNPYYQFFLSQFQFVGTAGCLYGSANRVTSHFLVAMIIQGNAFLMTLRRKNLAPQWLLLGTYALWLVIVLVAGRQEVMYYMGTLALAHFRWMAAVAILWRMGPPAPFNNKYVIWTTIAFILYTIQSTPQYDAWTRDNESKLQTYSRILYLGLAVPFGMLQAYMRQKRSEQKTIPPQKEA